MEPKFSFLITVVIPCYNHGIYINEAINSIPRRKDIEVIIVNDGSSDPHTIEKLNKLEEEGYFVLNQANQGLAAARNNAIRTAKGKYIIPLDSDNKLHENYLHTAITILEENPSIDIVYGNPIYFGDEAGETSIGYFNFPRILLMNYIDACAVFRKKVWERNSEYDGNMPAMGNEDWEFWIHAYLNGLKFFFLDMPCFYYRVLPNSMSVTTTRPGFESNREYIYQKHFKKIIPLLAAEAAANSRNMEYVRNYKLRAALKLFLGKEISV